MDAFEEFFAPIPPHERRCYLSLKRLWELLHIESVLDALGIELQIIEKNVKRSSWNRMTLEEKFREIAQEAHHLQTTERWYDVPAGEVIAAHIFCSTRLTRIVAEYWSRVRLEADLTEPVARWLWNDGGYDVFAEVPLAMKKADLFGCAVREESSFLGFNKRNYYDCVAIELKNDIQQITRAFDQLTSYVQYAHRAFLACTPAAAAEYLSSHAKARGSRGWDDKALHAKLATMRGVGLLLVEGEDIYEYEPILTALNPIGEPYLQESLRQLNDRTRYVFNDTTGSIPRGKVYKPTSRR